MSLASITQPDAVRGALSEAASIGREAFLRKYGFRVATKYFLLHRGRHFDSKAIMGAAHAYQHGTPLRARDFSGGASTVAARLIELGFTVVRGDAWAFDEGDVTLRSAVKDRYGGAMYGGIEPSRSTPNIIVYTDPEEGARHGYTYDKWDDTVPGLFHYTGEGPSGDQQFTDGNRAILEHADSGRTLRLFHTIDQKKRAGGKRQEYLGAFYLDPTNPWRHEPGIGTDGQLRQVIVFHLRKDDTAPAPGNGTRMPTLRPEEGAPSPEKPRIEITFVPSELNAAVEFEVSPQEPRLAQRAEARLVAEFEAWLWAKGHVTKRIRIEAPALEHALITDTYDTTENVLYEAKASVDRGAVRLAIGQLIDYLRFTDEMHGRVLLPEPPLIDLEDLIRSAGYGLAYRTPSGEWEISD